MTNTTPFEQWHKRKPKDFRIFGSPAYVHIPESQRRKLDPKSKKLFFVGCDWKTDKFYRVYDPSNRKVHQVSDTVIIDMDIGRKDPALTQASPEHSVDSFAWDNLPDLEIPDLPVEHENDVGGETSRENSPEFQTICRQPSPRKRCRSPSDTDSPIPPLQTRGRPKTWKTGEKWKKFFRETPPERVEEQSRKWGKRGSTCKTYIQRGNEKRRRK